MKQANKLELVHSTRDKLSKEEIKQIREAKKKAIEEGKIVRK